MKAAADAWGLKTSEFRRGFARETHDPATVAATMSKPGVVLRRPVGSNGPFTEHAELPKDLPIEKLKERRAKPYKEPPPRKTDTKTAKAAALAFEREQKRREAKRRREEVAREKERNRREQAIAKAERALEQAKREHEAKVQKIAKDRAALGRKRRMRDGKSKVKSWRRKRQKDRLAKPALQRSCLNVRGAREGMRDGAMGATSPLAGSRLCPVLCTRHRMRSRCT